MGQREGPGSRIGRYKILQEIGEGGFGVVYMAEQAEPVRRKVALKIIKLGMDTKQVVARFEAERQALALMDHPTSPRSSTAAPRSTGRPYFVMELVKGIPVTDYCDKAGSPPPSGSGSSPTSAARSSTRTRRASSTAT
jgi:serine/threonine protein kinase